MWFDLSNRASQDGIQSKEIIVSIFLPSMNQFGHNIQDSIVNRCYQIKSVYKISQASKLLICSFLDNSCSFGHMN